MDNTKQHWLAEEKEDLLSNGENDQRNYALRPALKRLLTKIFSHSARAIAYRRGKRLAYCFVPSPLRAYYWNEIAPKGKQFPTTYLTGMRGIAAVKVYTFHYLHFFSDATFVPWGRDDQHKLFLELPIVQFLYAGTTAQIFFVVAGYLMTLQIVQLFDKHEPASRSKAFLNISGALFRRVFRLYLPTFVITLITAHYIYLGLYEHNRNFFNQRDKYFPGPWTEPMPQQYSSYVAQMENWAQDMWGLLNLWAKTYRPQHDVHLWSILVEMQSSLVLYLILMATAQCRKLVRLAAMTIMTVVTLFWDHGETWMYVIGAVVALIDLLLTERAQEKKLALPTTKVEPSAATTAQGDGWKSRWSFILRSHFRDPTTTAWTAFRVFGHLIAFWTLSYPMWAYGFWGSDAVAPGYVTLNKFIPRNMGQKERFWPCIGTTIFLLLLARADPETSFWRNVFNTDWAQYLGKISFGLYLVQGPLLHAVVYLVPHWVWWSVGVEGIESSNFTWSVGIMTGWLVGLILLLWLADVWQREVETRTVKVAQKFEKWCFVKQA